MIKIYSKCKYWKRCKLYKKKGAVCNRFGGQYGEGKMATCYNDNKYNEEHLK